MTTQTLQGALQQAVRTAFSTANDFNGDLHAMCDFYQIPAAPISGRLISAANKFDASITDAASAMNYFLQNYASTVPTLALDFTSSSSLDSRITFTRGSQATLFDSAGTLRYAKHNLALQSQTFQTTWTTSQASVSTDATTAPDGTLSADKIVENLTTNYRYVNQTITVTAGTHTASVYAKSAGRTWLLIAFGSNPTNGGAWFNLSSGVVGTTQANVISAAIVDVGNGWYRCSVTVAMTAGSATYRISPTSADNVSSYEGDGTSGIFIWGGQLNLSNMEGGVTSSLTTYYPTTTAAYYGPRFDYDPSTLAARGLLIEEARTNSIRNNTMQGAVAGTPGTLPTNWTASSIGGVALTQVVGIGTENGIAYIDVRYAGTTSSTSSGGITTDGTTQIAALSGQNWASSFYIRLVGGSTSGITDIFNTIQERDAGGALLAATNTTISPTGLALNTQRVATTRTLNNASTAFVNQQLRITPQSGVAIDITLRIGLPQLEQGAFATSVIPTTTTALTRNADVASMTGTNFSSWFNAVEGTVVAEHLRYADAGVAQRFFEFDNTSTSSIRGYYTAADAVAVDVIDAGVSQCFLSTASGATANTVYKTAFALKVNDFSATSNGAAVQTDSAGAVPSMTRVFLGSTAGNSNFLQGYLRRISYYPSRLPNTTLQALTA